MRIPSGKLDQYVYFVALSSSDFTTRLTGISGTLAAYRSRNNGTATLYTTPTFSELSAANMPGVYALLVDEDTTIASTSDSEEYCLHITGTGMAPVTRTIELYRYPVTSGQSITVASGVPTVNVIQIDGQVTTGNNATLNLKQLNIVNSAGSALVATAGGGNFHGIAATGNGTGHGLLGTGGAGIRGDGIRGLAISSNGNGISGQGVGTGDGMSLIGGDSTNGDGLHCTGGAGTSNGIRTEGGATAGDGMFSTATAANGNGFRGMGMGTGDGMSLVGGNGSSGDGLHATGGTGNSNGIRTEGGGTSGDGFVAIAMAGNSNGITGTGLGTGDGMNLTGGAGANGDGLQATAGGGVDIRGNLSGSVASVSGDVGGDVNGDVIGSVGSVTGLDPTKLDVAVSTRLATAGYTAPDNVGIAGIKLKTDQLGFTVANQVNVNIQYVNDIQVNGDGQPATPWGP